MFARTIAMDQWAEVYEELECPRFTVLEDVMMVKGEHPHLGVVVAVQMMDDVISITTTVPFTDRADRCAAEQYDAITLKIKEIMTRKRQPARAA